MSRKRTPPTIPDAHQMIQSLPVPELHQYIELQKPGWKYARDVLIQRMTIGQLEKYVLQRRPGFAIAATVLKTKRRRGDNLARKPADAPRQPLIAPSSTDGDWWRIRGE